MMCYNHLQLPRASHNRRSYIHDDPGLVPLLEMLRASGKKLFVVSCGCCPFHLPHRNLHQMPAALHCGSAAAMTPGRHRWRGAPGCDGIATAAACALAPKPQATNSLWDYTNVVMNW